MMSYILVLFDYDGYAEILPTKDLGVLDLKQGLQKEICLKKNSTRKHLVEILHLSGMYINLSLVFLI